MALIFINPGHSKNGKPDCGCAYHGLRESDLSASIAEKLQEYLIKLGFEVKLYQQTGCNDNSSKQLNTVYQQANSAKADMFISIHMNGVINEHAKGTETLYRSGSIKGKRMAELINEELIKPYQDYTFANRGAKTDQRGLAVLKYTNMPAVLTEIGFISNEQESKMIVKYQKEIAQRLCIAICRYFGKDYQVINKHKTTISLCQVTDDIYDLKVNDKLILSGNKFSTCIDWLRNNYE